MLVCWPTDQESLHLLVVQSIWSSFGDKYFSDSCLV